MHNLMIFPVLSFWDFFAPAQWLFFALLLLLAIKNVLDYARLMPLAKAARRQNAESLSKEEEKQGVSLVIPGKSEYDNLKKNLPFWLEQKYPNFEIIVVYDASEEVNQILLKEYQNRYKRLKMINFTENVNFFEDERKFIVSLGLKSAENECVMIVDASTRPQSEYCIQEMQAYFKEGVDTVIGYNDYGNSRFSANFCRFFLLIKNLFLMLSALKKKPFLARNHNVVYRKEFFLKNRGYTSYYSVNSGEYDILSETKNTGENTVLRISESASTLSEVPLTLRTWFSKEKQFICATKASGKSPWQRWLLHSSSILLFYFVLLAYLLWGFFFLTPSQTLPYLWLYIPLCLYILKAIIQSIFLHYLAKTFKQKYFSFLFPFFELLYLPLQIVLLIYGISWNRKKSK